MPPLSIHRFFSLSRQETLCKVGVLSLFLVALLSTELGFASIVTGEPVWADKTTTLKEVLVEKLKLEQYPPNSLTEIRFQALNAQKITDLEKHNRDAQKAQQIGIPRNLKIEGEPNQSTSKLHWEHTADKKELVTQIKVTSPEARALRVGIKFLRQPLPRGLEMRVSGSAKPVQVILATSTVLQQQIVDQVYWTPVTDGESQTIEFAVPQKTNTDTLQIEIELISHILSDSSNQFKLAKALGDAASCHQDIVCVTSPSIGFLNATKAVAKMLYTKTGATFTCTGTLLNDTDQSTQIPYFFTANHCIDTQNIAKTLNTLWFFEAVSCNNPAPPTTTKQLSTGADFLYGSASKDITLLRLNEQPPAGAFFAGFDSNTLSSNTNIIDIHHPKGDVKKVSIGKVNGQVIVTEKQDSFHQVSWSKGSSEGGSSGSGLFTVDANQNYFLRGGMYGGSASCDNVGQSAGQGNADYFSRLDLAYQDIKKYLDPIEPLVDYSGIWGDPAENGWGLNFIKGSSGVTIAVWYTYDTLRQPTWYLLQNPKWINSTTLTGDFYRFTGPSYKEPFSQNLVSFQNSGTGTFTFSSPIKGTFQYSVNGVSQTKAIQKADF